MMWLILLIILLAIYLCGFFFAPFPLWKTYIYLWKAIFTKNYSMINLHARKKQAIFLLKYAIFSPIWTFFWYLDEILYSNYKSIEIKPIFIIGQPRCGTTFLHRTLAKSNQFVAIKHIEWRYPYIAFQKILKYSGLANIIMHKNYWPTTEAGRVAAKMHPNHLSDWEEEGIFFEECFLHHFFIYFRFPYPDIFEYLDNFQNLPDRIQRQIMHTHRKVIQKMFYLHHGAGKFYLSKEVTSHDKIPYILKLYPEARFIVSLRKSNDFLNSLLPLVKFSTQSKNGIDPMYIPGWENKIIQKMKKDCSILMNISDNHVFQQNQIKVVFSHLITDVKSTINQIFAFLQLDISEEYQTYLSTLHERQKRRNRGYENDKRRFCGFQDYDRFVQKAELEACSQHFRVVPSHFLD